MSVIYDTTNNVSKLTAANWNVLISTKKDTSLWWMILVITGSLKIGKFSILNGFFSAVDKVLRAPQYVQIPHYSNHDFSPLVNGVYLIAIIDKTKCYKVETHEKLRGRFAAWNQGSIGHLFPFFKLTQFCLLTCYNSREGAHDPGDLCK